MIGRRHLSWTPLAITGAAFALLLAPSTASSAVRIRVDWSIPQFGHPPGPIIFVHEAREGPLVASYNHGRDCALLSGAPCEMRNPAARWVEGNFTAYGQAQTVSLEVDGPPVPYRYSLVHPAGEPGFSPPFDSTINGTVTIYRPNGSVDRIPLSLPAGKNVILDEDPAPPRPKKLPKLSVLREFPAGGRKLVVRRNRVVTYKDVALACGTQDKGTPDDRPCVASGYVSALRVEFQTELRSPILGRYRISANAGDIVPIRIKLSRFGLRYVKRHAPLNTYLVIRYSIKGEAKDKRSSFLAKVRFRPR